MRTSTLNGVQISSLTRVRTNGEGNPVWRAYLDNGAEIETADGAPCAYSIDNAQFRGVPLVLTLNNGKIWTIRRAL